MRLPPAWTHSLRFQLTAWSLAAVTAILLLAATLCDSLVRAGLRRETDQALTNGAAQILRQLSSQASPADSVQRASLPPVTLPGVGADALYLRLIRAGSGKEAAHSPNLSSQSGLRAALAGLPPAPRGPIFAGTEEENSARVLTVAVPRAPYLLQVAAPWDPVEDLLARLLIGLSLACLLFLLLCGVGSWLLVGRALRPIEHIVTEAEGLTAARLPPALLSPRALSDNEIGHLVAALNRMLTRLSAAFTAQRQFTADASHELRTPLTILRGEFELALSRDRSLSEYRRALESGLEETLRMTRIVDSLALLARGDAARPAAPLVTVSLQSLAEEAAAALARPAEAKRLRLSVAAADAANLRGDPDTLRRMIRNLLENAVAYTPSGGKITVLVSQTETESRLTVADTGIGIAPEDLPHVFDRFYRADKARANTGGSGLGLAIVQSIVFAHRGEITVESEPGIGSQFTVTFPADEKSLICI